MLIQALYELSVRNKLVDDPLYEKRPVDYLVRISAAGKLLSLEPTQDERGRGIPRSIPRIPKRAVNIAPGFFVDNAKHIQGAVDDVKPAAFRALVSACAAATGDEGAKAVERFLKAGRGEALRRHDGKDWTGSELLAFVLDDAPRECVHDRKAVRKHWATLNREAESEAGPPVRCMVTGELAPMARLHPSIKRVPEAQPSGASLVSFNWDAFTSHRLEQGANAPISTKVAIGYTTALNFLLEGTPSRRFRNGVLNGDAVTVFWAREDANFAQTLLQLMDPTEEDVLLLADSPLRGIAPAPLDETRFYATTLSGSAARVVVRDWLETTVGQVKSNLRRYFDDLRLGVAPAKPTPIWSLLKSIEAPGGRGVAPETGTRLMSAALRGTPFPRELLAAALRRLRLPPDANERLHLHLRCALVKATLLRLPHSSLEIPVSLDEKKLDRPYLLGRLFAAIERLQGIALGDVGATVRDRFFGSASMTPALVFGRLLKLSMHHASKAGPKGRWVERVKSQIVAGLDSFPAVQTLEEQGLFAIGYYHQREAFFTKAPEDPTASDAPDSADPT